MSVSYTAVIGSAFATAAVGVASYAVYFDYKRRTDPQFRRVIKKQREYKLQKEQAELKAKEDQMVKLLTRAMSLVKDEVYPTDVESREAYFMENLQKGELLFRQGAHMNVEAAACFFNAVKVYPNPVDLLVILQKSIPEDVVGLVYAMISTEEQMQQIAGKQ